MDNGALRHMKKAQELFNSQMDEGSRVSFVMMLGV